MYRERTIEEVLPLMRALLAFYSLDLPCHYLEVPVPPPLRHHDQRHLPFTYREVIAAIDRKDEKFCNHLYAMQRRQGLDGDYDPVTNLQELIAYCRNPALHSSAGTAHEADWQPGMGMPPA